MPDPDETTGTENAGAADQQTGDTDQTDGQAEGSQAAAEQGTNEVEGLKAAAQAERVKRQEAEAVVEDLKTQQAIINAQPPQTQQSQKSMYSALAERLGIDPEYPSPEDNGRIMEAMMQINNVQMQNQSFFSSHPDYSQVVGTALPNGSFNIAPPLQRVIKDNPALQSQIAGLTPAVLYQLAVTDKQYQKDLADKGKSKDITDSEKAEAAIKAAAAKASISNAGGGGSLDKVNAIASMSDEDFDKHIEEIKSDG